MPCCPTTLELLADDETKLYSQRRDVILEMHYGDEALQLLRRVLPAFFVEEAYQLLMALPTPYWFWSTISNCAHEHYHSVNGDKARITSNALLSNLVCSRASYYLSFDLDSVASVSELKPYELASRAVEGAILLDRDSGELRFNPIFAPGQGRFRNGPNEERDLALCVEKMKAALLAG